MSCKASKDRNRKRKKEEPTGHPPSFPYPGPLSFQVAAYFFRLRTVTIPNDHRYIVQNNSTLPSPSLLHPLQQPFQRDGRVPPLPLQIGKDHVAVKVDGDAAEGIHLYTCICMVI